MRIGLNMSLTGAGSVSPLALYAVLGIKPELVFDFDANQYFVNSERSTFSDSITHSRASTATYVDSTGTLQTAGINEPRIGHHIYNGSAWVNEGLLHESEARTNLVPYSEITIANWSGSATITDGAATDPTGNSNAAKITETATLQNHAVSSGNATIVSGAVTGSAFLKAGERRYARIRLDQTSAQLRSWFDVQEGTITHEDLVGSSTITPVGNGWYRCTVTELANTASSSSSRVQIFVQSASGNQTTYTGDGTSGLYAYGAQLEAGSTPSSYIPTSGSTATRAAETLTVPAANMPWPTPNVIGDELVTNGTFDSGISGWTDASSGTSSFTASSGRGLLTVVGADRARARQSFSVTVGKIYRVSFEVFDVIDVNIGHSVDASTEYRAGAASVGTNVILFVAVASTVYFQFHHVVAGTREFDNVSVREIDPLAVSIQMDGRMAYADEGASTEVRFWRWRADSSNQILSRIDASGSLVGRYITQQTASGTYDQATDAGTEAYAPGINVPFNIASRHGSTFINAAADGTSYVANTTPVALPDLSATNFELGHDYIGTIKQLRVWPEDLTDAGIEEAST